MRREVRKHLFPPSECLEQASDNRSTPSRVNRSRRGNQSMRKRCWLWQTVQLFPHISVLGPCLYLGKLSRERGSPSPPSRVSFSELLCKKKVDPFDIKNVSGLGCQMQICSILRFSSLFPPHSPIDSAAHLRA